MDWVSVASVIGAIGAMATFVSILVGIGMLRSLPVANSKAIDELRAIVQEQSRLLNEMRRDGIHTEKQLNDFKGRLDRLDERLRTIEINQGTKA